MSISVPRIAGALGQPREVRRDVDLALLEQVPVGLVGDLAGGLGRVGIVGHRLGDRAPFYADVVRLAEEELEQRALGVALGLFERADADEQRARDDAAEVEDHGADHVGECSRAERPSSGQGPDRRQQADSGGAIASVRSAVAAANAITRASVSVTSRVTPARARRPAAVAAARRLRGRLRRSRPRRLRLPAPSTVTAVGSNAASTSTIEPRGGRKPSFGATCTARSPSGTTASSPVRFAVARWGVNTIASRSNGTTTMRPTARRGSVMASRGISLRVARLGMQIVRRDGLTELEVATRDDQRLSRAERRRAPVQRGEVTADDARGRQRDDERGRPRRQ